MSTVMSTERGVARQSRHIRAEDQGGGIVVGIFSDMSIDAHNTVLVPDGCDYRLYMNNSRAVNWHHGDDHRGRVPIATTESIRIEGRKLVGTIRFGSDSFSQSVYHSFRDGTTRGFSIEFMPKKGQYGPPKKEEVRACPDWRNVETIYRGWQLLGVAATPCPSNANAIAIEVRSRKMNPGVVVSPELSQVIADNVARAMLAEHPEMCRWVFEAKRRQHALEEQARRHALQMEQDAFLRKIEYLPEDQQRTALRAFQEAQRG